MTAATKIRTLIGGGQVFFCPGCNESHALNQNGRVIWSYNGDPSSPTFTPSLLMTSGHYVQGQEGKPCWCTYNATAKRKAPVSCVRCHSFVTAGRIQFLGDCSHALAGQTVDIPAWPHAPNTYGGIEEEAP
jgi:hypothetical protein